VITACVDDIKVILCLPYFVTLLHKGGRNIAISMSVCLPVCLCARISRKPVVQISRNFLSTLPVVVARSSDSSAIGLCYAHPVLWMA